MQAKGSFKAQVRMLSVGMDPTARGIPKREKLTSQNDLENEWESNKPMLVENLKSKSLWHVLHGLL
jgi:hypothetical protein